MSPAENKLMSNSNMVPWPVSHESRNGGLKGFLVKVN